MRFRLPLQVVSVLLFFAAARQTASGLADEPWKVTWEPARPVNGSAVLFRVTAPADVTALHGAWSGHELSFRFDRPCACWYAVAGIDLDAKPGKQPLRLEGSAKAQTKATSNALYSSAVTIGAKRYPTTAITVAPEYVQPPQDVLARIEQEAALKKQVFSQIAPDSYWMGRFKPPVDSSVTAIFGSARTYNGVKKSTHQGIDFRAAIGTTVRATNQGTVVLARGLYYEGNCVVIDHGQGLETIYMHLSEIRVKEGQKVEGGEILGLSGNSGRVTAPHLHFAVRWQGIYLDPATLLELHPPEK
jgi:murein DD-endopeptidase MepM/ murein hydrolase activator NlpD